jgi:hypothetical protein
MRSAVFLSCLLLTVIASLHAQSDEPDAYSINVVRHALSKRSGTPKIINSWSQKQLLRLGDGVSIALIKALDERDLTDPATVRDFLPMIRDSFAEPRLIAVEEDRKPKVTLLLLNFLQRSVLDTPTQEAIGQTVEYVQGRVRQ